MNAQARKARRAAKQAQSIATAAEIWEPREGKERPTPERRAKGAFVLRDTEDAGVTVAVDEGATELDRLAIKGVISMEQRDGGHDFASLMWRTRMVSEGRSCLDFSVKGFDNSEPTRQEIEDERDRKELYLAMGTFAWRECWSVCVQAKKVSDLESLKRGLDTCVKFFG